MVPKYMMNKELLNLDIHIKEFEKIVSQYPNNKAYQRRLAHLEQQRVEIVNKIGKKK